MATTTFRASATPAVHGAALTFETIGPDADAGERLRPLEDTLLRIVDGVVRLTVGAGERLLWTGDEAIVPAGTGHRLSGVGAEATVVMGFRPGGLAAVR
jgi:mannose-6-phosphate isomerase-like protein (cupin superfamily)